MQRKRDRREGRNGREERAGGEINILQRDNKTRRW